MKTVFPFKRCAESMWNSGKLVEKMKTVNFRSKTPEIDVNEFLKGREKLRNSELKIGCYVRLNINNRVYKVKQIDEKNEQNLRFRAQAVDKMVGFNFLKIPDGRGSHFYYLFPTLCVGVVRF